MMMMNDDLVDFNNNNIFWQWRSILALRLGEGTKANLSRIAKQSICVSKSTSAML